MPSPFAEGVFWIKSAKTPSSQTVTLYLPDLIGGVHANPNAEISHHWYPLASSEFPWKLILDFPSTETSTLARIGREIFPRGPATPVSDLVMGVSRNAASEAFQGGSSYPSVSGRGQFIVTPFPELK